MPYSACQALFLFAILPSELNECLRVERVSGNNTRAHKLAYHPVSFRLDRFQEMQCPLGIESSETLFPYANKMGTTVSIIISNEAMPNFFGVSFDFFPTRSVFSSTSRARHETDRSAACSPSLSSITEKSLPDECNNEASCAIRSSGKHEAVPCNLLKRYASAPSVNTSLS